MAPELGTMGITVSTTPAGMHNRVLERDIQTFKGRKRSILATLPYELPTELHLECDAAVVRGMNRTIGSALTTRRPTEIFTGAKPRIPKFLFGQPGIIYSPRADAPGQHGEWGMFLSERDGKNNLRVYFPLRKAIFSRRRFEPMTTYPEQWGFKPRLRAPEFRTRKQPAVTPLDKQPPPQLNWKESTVPPVANIEVQTGLPLTTPSLLAASSERRSTQESADKESDHQGTTHQESGSNAAQTIAPLPIENQPTAQQESVPKENPPPPQQEETQPTPSTDPPQSPQIVPTTSPTRRAKPPPAQTPTPASQHDTEPTDALNARGLPRRSAAQQSYRDGPVKMRKATMSSTSTINAYRISFNAAMKDLDRRDATEAAIAADFTNLFVDQKAMDPVRLEDIPPEHKQFIINGHFFCKDKYDASGTFERSKGRFVLNGNEEPICGIEETKSPTVTSCSVLTAIALTASDAERGASAYDIDSAFACTKMRDGKIIIVRVSTPGLVVFLVKIFPVLKDFVSEDNCLYFYLLKFLCGLPEAAREFFLSLMKAFIEIGFKQSEADDCVFLKTVQGKVHVLCVHVDDIFSSAPSREARLRFEADLQKHFKIKKQIGKSLSYLGMVINRQPSGDMIVHQRGFMLKRFDVNEKPVTTPARPHLLNEDDKEDVQLRDAEKRGFVSMVMSIMYLARLTRPDMLMTTTYLATKCQSPTVTHYNHVRWLLRYLKGTRDLGLRYKAGIELKLKMSCDASHSLHADGKGHSGFVALLGSATVLAQSRKHRSSMDAELIAAEDCSTNAYLLRAILRSYGIITDKPTEVEQDNQSAIMFLQKGRAFKRSQHLIGRLGYP